MSGSLILIISIILLVLAYRFYGSFIASKFNIDDKNITPAHRLRDDIDYIPAPKGVLIGHHFASIAGAAPIIGPIVATTFGWLPSLIWIVVGAVFIGSVHDFTSLMASIKHDGKGIGDIIEKEIGQVGKYLFLGFTWLTLILVIAVFAAVVSKSFVSSPASASSSLFFIVLAVIFGLILKSGKINFKLLTTIAVILLFSGVYLGNLLPVTLSINNWIYFLLGYIVVASLMPVWLLLQPRDFLSSFLLYSMMGVGIISIIMYNPTFEMPAIGNIANNKLGSIFPFLFITIACGAISGFHSIVASGTTSKQLNKESDAKMVGYGSMLIESILAVIALITSAYLTSDLYSSQMSSGGPIVIFSNGLAEFSKTLGLPYNLIKNFIILTIGSFALTTLDTSARLARYSWQEFFTINGKKSLMSNQYIAIGITVIAAGSLALTGLWKEIWPLFGAANQLLAALALLTIFIWMKKKNKGHLFFLMIPMIFMYSVTVSALAALSFKSFVAGNIMLGGLAFILLILALVLLVIGIPAIKRKKVKNS